MTLGLAWFPPNNDTLHERYEYPINTGDLNQKEPLTRNEVAPCRSIDLMSRLIRGTLAE